MIDTHTHLNDGWFDADRAVVRERARAAGVHFLIHCGYSISSSEQALELAREWGDGAAVGIHPHDAEAMSPEALRRLRELSRDPRVVAIGETGLDHHYDRPPRDLQRGSFLRQIELAAELSLPLVIHSRESHTEVVECLRGADCPSRGVFHCFTGTREQAAEVLDLGFYLGIGGVVTFPKSVDLRQVVAEVPEDRLLLETDSPYLAPVPHRGKRCEPAYVRQVLEVVAEARGEQPDAVEKATTRNALRCFPRLGALLGLAAADGDELDR